MQKLLKYQLTGSILATNRTVDLFCRKTSLNGQMTHQLKAVQDQIKAENFSESARSSHLA